MFIDIDEHLAARSRNPCAPASISVAAIQKPFAWTASAEQNSLSGKLTAFVNVFLAQDQSAVRAPGAS
jgi:hypothetical protein